MKEEKIMTNINLLLVHISQHQNTPEEEQENSSTQLFIHLRWSKEKTETAIKEALKRNYIIEKDSIIHLTTEGHLLAKTLTEW